MILRKTSYALSVVGMLVGAGSSWTATAQTVAGPLAQTQASDGAAAKTPAKKPHPLKKVAQTKSKTAEKPKPAALEPWAAVDPSRVAPTPPPEAPLPPASANTATAVDAKPDTHPELAMKWNGNNDSATQTRAQNYGGDAEGAGAAMGLKFHF